MAIRDRIKETVDKATGGSRSGNSRRHGKQDSGGFAGFGQAFEDLIAFAGDMRGQAATRAQGELEKLAAKLDLVTRREFEAVRAIAIAARTQAERLEAQLNGGRSGKAASVKRAATAKASAKPASAKTNAKAKSKAKAATPAGSKSKSAKSR